MDSKIQEIESNIDKNKDALVELNENQEFLLDLSDQEFKIARKARIEKNTQEAFENWIAIFKTDHSQDDIIFDEDEDIHGDIKLSDIDESLLL
jgi:hypothetical protein